MPGYGGANCLNMNQCAVTRGVGAKCPTGTTCVDKDPLYTCVCADNTANCGCTQQGCPNGYLCNKTTNACVAKSFYCATACETGYVAQGDGCTDIDECTEETADCPAHSTCQNTDGSYKCPCNSGYTDAKTSVDNLVIEPRVRIQFAEEFEVELFSTRRLFALPSSNQASGASCTDINECTQGTANCTARRTCVNTPGSFECPCAAGYSGATCCDIDECAIATTCTTDRVCLNTPGSYKCVPCPQGTQMDANAKGCVQGEISEVESKFHKKIRLHNVYTWKF